MQHFPASANGKESFFMLDVFLFFTENILWHLIQIVTLGDKLCEMLKLVFCEK